MNQIFQINLPKNFHCLLAIIGFGIVVVGAGGFEVTTPNTIIEGSGVAVIFADMLMYIWIRQKNLNARNKRNDKIAETP